MKPYHSDSIVMKLLVQLVICVFLVGSTNSYRTMLKRDIHIMDTIENKTSLFINNVKAKFRNIKNFCNDKLKNIFTSDFDDESTEITMIDKFKDYIEISKKMASTVYDSIAPVKIKHQCSDAAIVNTMTTTQLTALHGYISESHTIRTDDGYMLTLHRLPFPKNTLKDTTPRKTVLMHHGLLGSSADWVIPGLGKGLAYILSDAGYDVWMANVRGNIYSRAHVSYNVDTDAFWNFTFHEVSQYDLPAAIDYIIDKKGNIKIDYIGFSMGTTALFALLSTKTQYNNVLRAGFALAPVAYMTNIKSPIKLIAKFSNNIEYMMKLFGAKEFLPRNAFVRYLSKHSCKISRYEDALCEISMFVFCGHDKVHFDRSLRPIIFGHIPAGASTKTFTHYAQEINNEGRFQQFDYGPEGNIREYGVVKPPEYPVEKITLPIALISGKGDWLSSVADASILYKKLRNPIEHYIVPMKDFNHLNFLFAVDTQKLVYDKLLQIMGNSVEDSNIEMIDVNDIV